MKIAIPSESNIAGAAVCQSFGRTPYYAIYDTKINTITYLENAAAASAGGAGIKAAQEIVDSGIDAIITYRCGENAANVLNSAGIKMYRAADGTVENNIELFAAGKLELLAEIHSGFHNHGGNK